jgi:hypothetical protein
VEFPAPQQILFDHRLDSSKRKRVWLLDVPPNRKLQLFPAMGWIPLNRSIERMLVPSARGPMTISCFSFGRMFAIRVAFWDYCATLNQGRQHIFCGTEKKIKTQARTPEIPSWNG